MASSAAHISISVPGPLVFLINPQFDGVSVSSPLACRDTHLYLLLALSLSAPYFFHFLPLISLPQPLSLPSYPVPAFYQNLSSGRMSWLPLPYLQLICCWRKSHTHPGVVTRFRAFCICIHQVKLISDIFFFVLAYAYFW